MSDWFGVCQLKDLPPGGKQVFDMDETMVLVTNIDGELSAIEDVCTHDGGELGSGEMDGCEIICPRHGARFCLKTGKALTAPAYEDVAKFPLKVENDIVFVRDDRWD